MIDDFSTFELRLNKEFIPSISLSVKTQYLSNWLSLIKCCHFVLKTWSYTTIGGSPHDKILFYCLLIQEINSLYQL